jgi:hypothetical protein
MADFITFVFNSIVFTFSLFMMYSTLKRQPKEEPTLLPEDVELITLEEVEQSGKTYWLVHSYNEPKQFLAQGFSREEAIANTAARFPDKNIFEVI